MELEKEVMNTLAKVRQYELSMNDLVQAKHSEMSNYIKGTRKC